MGRWTRRDDLCPPVPGHAGVPFMMGLVLLLLMEGMAMDALWWRCRMKGFQNE